jgi:hypothetical protein
MTAPRKDKLTRLEQVILVLVFDGTSGEPRLNTGDGLSRRMREAGFGTSSQGCHLTAGSLVRKGLINRIPAIGYNRPVRYVISDAGMVTLTEARARWLSKHPFPSAPLPGPGELRRTLVGGRR